MYPYGLIGNCQSAALVSTEGSIDWLCWPRPDSPPVFGKLLDPQGGNFNIQSHAPAKFHQSYEINTNILQTTVTQENGSVYKITDFCPRFIQHGRNYRPNAIFRKVERVSGAPRITVSIQPVSGWEKEAVAPVRGNSHLAFTIRDEQMRLTTNLSLTYLLENIPVLVEEPLYFALTWGFGLEDDLMRVSEEFLYQTRLYWQRWVQHCSIPVLFQKEVIRSALALKLHCYEDTGAILAALTTSLPEEIGKNRNWDYRFCWLRDAYYVLSAFRNLGHYEEMEGFLKFFLNIAESTKELQPV